MPRRKARTSEKIRHKRRVDCDKKMRQYRRRIEMAKARLGGVCAVDGCGERERLEFDHVDPLRKRHDIQSLWSYSLERFLDEVDKCQLLCPEHHHLKTAEDKRLGLHRLRVKERRDAEDPVPF